LSINFPENDVVAHRWALVSYSVRA
jgi:hypothetical protein